MLRHEPCRQREKWGRSKWGKSGSDWNFLQRGHNRQPIFFHEDNYRFYLECLQETTARHATAVHAYVLMTNHVHVLMTPHQPNSIAKVMQALGRRYVPYINATYQRTGTLWEGRYRASLVDADRYLLACYRYIELNPVRAGMVQQPAVQARHAAYEVLCQHHLDAGLLQEIRATLNQCRVLGTERFKDAIEATLARRVRLGKPGRPRKPGKAQELLASAASASARA